MASTKQEGTAAAAEQLGSLSLSGSEERKDDETKPTTKNGTPMCSECGKKSNTLKKCTACKCVWYCDKKCQNKHRKEHKKECRRIKSILDERGGKLNVGTEVDVGHPGKLPPREECSICMRVLPISTKFRAYMSCCGKTLCCGCMHQHKKKNGEWDASGQPLVLPTCAFCRTPTSKSDKEYLARLRKRVEQKDPNALRNMSGHYGYGECGLSVDQTKCIDLMRQSAALGCPFSQYQLGVLHSTGDMGLEQDDAQAKMHWEKAAEGGHLTSRHNLACKEASMGNHIAAMRHWRSAASGGQRSSMEGVIGCFEAGALRHGDLAATLQAFYLARSEMKSADRDEYIRYLKMTGQFDEEFDYPSGEM